MKLKVTNDNLKVLKQQFSFIFNTYKSHYSKTNEILELNIPMFEDVDYTEYMSNLSSKEKLTFAIDAINYSI